LAVKGQIVLNRKITSIFTSSLRHNRVSLSSIRISSLEQASGRRIKEGSSIREFIEPPNIEIKRPWAIAGRIEREDKEQWLQCERNSAEDRVIARIDLSW
jgi:hypothetical protein